MSDLDQTREQLVNALVRAREQITQLQRQLVEYQQVDVAYPEMLLKAVPELILLIDRDGVIAECKAAEEEPLCTSLPPEKVVGERYMKLFPPDFTGPVSEGIAAGRRSSKVFSVDFQMDLPGAGRRDLQAWVKVFPGGSSACAIRCLRERSAISPEESAPGTTQTNTIDAIRAHIQAANSVEEALQVAARELGQALNAERVTVQFNPHQPGRK
jgi:hypothetical protein